MCVRVGTETTGSLKYRVDDLQEPDHLTTCTCVLGGNREVGVSCILTETEKGKEKIKIATATKRKGGIKRLKDSKVKEEIGKEGKKIGRLPLHGTLMTMILSLGCRQGVSRVSLGYL